MAFKTISLKSIKERIFKSDHKVSKDSLGSTCKECEDKCEHSNIPTPADPNCQVIPQNQLLNLNSSDDEIEEWYQNVFKPQLSSNKNQRTYASGLHGFSGMSGFTGFSGVSGFSGMGASCNNFELKTDDEKKVEKVETKEEPPVKTVMCNACFGSGESKKKINGNEFIIFCETCHGSGEVPESVEVENNTEVKEDETQDDEKEKSFEVVNDVRRKHGIKALMGVSDSLDGMGMHSEADKIDVIIKSMANLGHLAAPPPAPPKPQTPMICE